jgi:hypothetical protein
MLAGENDFERLLEWLHGVALAPREDPANLMQTTIARRRAEVVVIVGPGENNSGMRA